MDIQQYINYLKETYSNILLFVDNENESSDDYQILINYFKKEKISEDRDKLYEVLKIILKIFNNHRRSPGFSDKIKKLILYLSNSIKQTYSNSEIINIFKTNKFIFHFLLQNKIINLDQSSLDQFDEINDETLDFFSFFYPEFEQILDEKSLELIKPSSENLIDFEEKRKNGENSSYICTLIRNDSVQDFISHVTRESITLSAEINPSIFETNNFLVGKKVTLIEYAAFYGSIQIFQYLRLNNVNLTPSLWSFTIHGKNAELIHLLEENNVETQDETFNCCLYESIKCHHNDFANYFMEKVNYITNNDFIDCCFQYDNFEFFPKNVDKSFFNYFFKYDYVNFVKFLLNNGEFDINQSIILTKSIFFSHKVFNFNFFFSQIV